jgi:chemotaxis protein MotB
MATFADMATLLMAFFVLILSFAEFNQPKFKMVAGSLKNSFGVQRQIPVFEQPKGTTIIDMSFSPSPQPTVVKQMKQETTDTEKREIETKDSQTPTDGDGKGDAGDNDKQSQSDVEAKVEDGRMAMNLSAEGADEAKMQQQMEEVTETLQNLAEQTGQSPAEVMLEQLKQAAQSDQSGTGEAQGDGSAQREAALAEAKLRVALRREVSEGLVTIEQKEDRVLVTVGAGGAFPSGTADLTADARDIMSRLAFSAMNDASRIEVTGHTDDVPLGAGSQFGDNWGLAAARSASVVRELAASNLIEGDRLTAIGKGESEPVADNSTAEGREQNRRIEIEIVY